MNSHETNSTPKPPESVAADEALAVTRELYDKALVHSPDASSKLDDNAMEASRMSRIRDWTKPYLENAKNNLSEISRISVNASKVAYEGLSSVVSSVREERRRNKEVKREDRRKNKEAKRAHKDDFERYLTQLSMSALGLENPSNIRRVEPRSAIERRKEHRTTKQTRKYEKRQRKEVAIQTMYPYDGRVRKWAGRKERAKHLIRSERDYRSGSATPAERRTARRKVFLPGRMIVTDAPKQVRKGREKRASVEDKLHRKVANSPAFSEVHNTDSTERTANGQPPSAAELERYRKGIRPMAILGLRKKIAKETKAEVVVQMNLLRHRNDVENLGLYEDQIAAQAEMLAGPVVTKRLFDQHFGLTGDEFEYKLPEGIRNRAEELLTMPEEELELLIYPSKAPVKMIEKRLSREELLNRQRARMLTFDENLIIMNDQIDQIVEAKTDAQKQLQGVDILSHEDLKKLRDEAREEIIQKYAGTIRLTPEEFRVLEKSLGKLDPATTT